MTHYSLLLLFTHDIDIITLFLQMEKLSYVEVKYFAEGHTVRKGGLQSVL
jgi:hypothetical protein